MGKKKQVRNKTGLFIACPCGSKAAITETGWGYYGHCPNCGRLSFFRNPALLEKVRLGGKSLCPHQPKLIQCKGGWTCWCEKCRIRVFVPEGKTAQ